MYNKLAVTITCVFLLSPAAQAQDWQPITGADNITALFSDTTHSATLREGKTATAVYNADGTGELRAWGDVIERRWHVEGDDQVCIEIGTDTRCFTLEVDASDPDMHRATNVVSDETVVFSVSDREVTATAAPAGAAGSASEPSAEEIAAKLANPNAPMASLTFRCNTGPSTATCPVHQARMAPPSCSSRRSRFRSRTVMSYFFGRTFQYN